MGMNDLVGKKVEILTTDDKKFKGLVIDGTITINMGNSQLLCPFGIIRKVKVIG